MKATPIANIAPIANVLDYMFGRTEAIKKATTEVLIEYYKHNPKEVMDAITPSQPNWSDEIQSLAKILKAYSKAPRQSPAKSKFEGNDLLELLDKVHDSREVLDATKFPTIDTTEVAAKFQEHLEAAVRSLKSLEQQFEMAEQTLETTGAKYKDVLTSVPRWQMDNILWMFSDENATVVKEDIEQMAATFKQANEFHATIAKCCLFL